MNTIVKVLLFGILLISLSTFGSTFAYFSDSERSSNTITAGEWDTEAESLQVNVSKSKLTGNDKKLHGTTIKNTGDEDIIIERIQVYWNATQKNANITEIKISGQTFFSGISGYGEIIDGNDFILEPERPPSKITFNFDSPVSSPFEVVFTMSDDSTKSAYIWIAEKH